MEELKIIAGPCSVESEKQIIEIALKVKNAGANFLRGGAYKIRTHADSFQGLGAEGLKMLVKAGKESGLKTVSEVTEIRSLDLFEEIDVIQVGERNMQNTDLLKELGKLKKTILLKRGRGCTIDELLASCEYILGGGNEDIWLCERGIRTFETATRNTLDLSAIPVLHERCSFPVIADPSHGTGHAEYVESMTLAAVAAGADGVEIEVHTDPENALSDGFQAITPDDLKRITEKIHKIRDII